MYLNTLDLIFVLIYMRFFYRALPLIPYIHVSNSTCEAYTLEILRKVLRQLIIRFFTSNQLGVKCLFRKFKSKTTRSLVLLSSRPNQLSYVNYLRLYVLWPVFLNFINTPSLDLNLVQLSLNEPNNKDIYEHRTRAHNIFYLVRRKNRIK